MFKACFSWKLWLTVIIKAPSHSIKSQPGYYLFLCIKVVFVIPAVIIDIYYNAVSGKNSFSVYHNGIKSDLVIEIFNFRYICEWLLVSLSNFWKFLIILLLCSSIVYFTPIFLFTQLFWNLKNVPINNCYHFANKTVIFFLLFKFISINSQKR